MGWLSAGRQGQVSPVNAAVNRRQVGYGGRSVRRQAPIRRVSAVVPPVNNPFYPLPGRRVIPDKSPPHRRNAAFPAAGGIFPIQAAETLPEIRRAQSPVQVQKQPLAQGIVARVAGRAPSIVRRRQIP